MSLLLDIIFQNADISSKENNLQAIPKLPIVVLKLSF